MQLVRTEMMLQLVRQLVSLLVKICVQVKLSLTCNFPFVQRYFMNNKYYKSGGPVFLSIGGEGPANPVWMENGAWIQYAQEHNAMLFMVEHRYYGQTHPTRYGSCLLLEGIPLSE